MADKVADSLSGSRKPANRFAEQTVIPTNLVTIARHDKQKDNRVDKLVVTLREWEDGRASSFLHLEGIGTIGYPLGIWPSIWPSIQKAREEYNALLEKLKQGKYMIDVYDSRTEGFVKIDLRWIN